MIIIASFLAIIGQLIFFSPAKAAGRPTADPFSSKQWWIYNDGTYGTAGEDLNIISFWQSEKKEWKDVSIGLVDSGVNTENSDIATNIKQGYDFVKKTGKLEKMQDKDGHGSFIAGLIAAKVSNKKGIAGMSHKNNLRIIPLRFGFTTGQAVKAVRYAQKKRIRVLNMSWGTEDYDQELYDAIKGYSGLVVAAAGNEGKSHDTGRHYYPCDFNLDNIICVGASTEKGELASYSDYGSTVDILAPGGESAELISVRKSKRNKYGRKTGSSYAAAFVSGTAGLMISKNPAITTTQIKDIILTSIRKKDFLAGKVCSNGILDVSSALSQVSR